MKNKLKIILLSTLFPISLQAFAYKEETHEELSRAAIDISMLANEQTLGDMGLEPGELYPDSNGDARDVKNLIRVGANFEDSLAYYRPINHFFNPLDGSGLQGIGAMPSPNWALEDRGSSFFQSYSFRDAREYFFKGLTEGEKTDRDKNLGLTFQTIGMVIHHVQDMAQPQHVRNDPHLEGRYIPRTLENPSLYELFTNNNRGVLPYGGYPAVYSESDTTTFSQPRHFWEKDSGVGMAQFTNTNFVSAGTNFDKPGMFSQPQLDPANQIEEMVENLCKSALFIPPCPSGISGQMTFYRTVVNDRYTGQSLLNPMTSTESLFSADLERKSFRKAFTLNRFNFAVAHGFLIPRAVGYSAGLINYFFRGKMDMEQDPAKTGKFVIRNLGKEDMAGAFELYYDGVDDKRYQLSASTLNAVAGEATSSIALLPIPDVLPAARTPGEYMLVFHGDMGEERASTQADGAVVGKVFTDPYQMQLTRLLFEASAPNRYNPTATYGLFGRLAHNQALGQVVALTNETFRLVVNDKNYPCAVYGAVLVWCYGDVYPYEEFYYDPTGGWSGSPQLEWNKALLSSGKLSLFLGDAVLFSFSYAADAQQTYAPVRFPKSFRWDASSATQIKSGTITW